jgi:hypothetical protein
LLKDGSESIWIWVNGILHVNAYELGKVKQTKDDPSTFTSYEKFIYTLSAKELKRQYPGRLQMFLDHLNIKSSSTEENSNLFFEVISRNRERNWLGNELVNFLQLKI